MSKQNLEVVSDVHFTGPTESDDSRYKYDMLLSHLYSLSSGTPMVPDQTNKYEFYVNNVEYTVPGVYVQPQNTIDGKTVEYIFSESSYIDEIDGTLEIEDVRLLILSNTVASLLNGNALKIITEQINGRSDNYKINSTNIPDYKVIQTFIPYGHNIVFKRLAFRKKTAAGADGKEGKDRYSYSKFWIDWCASIGPTYDPEYDSDNKLLFKTPVLNADEILGFTLKGNIVPEGNVSLGTLSHIFDNIYGTTGIFTKIQASQISSPTSNSGYGTKTDLFGSNGILKDIDHRLTQMGFKKGSLNANIQGAEISTIGTYTFVFFPANTTIPSEPSVFQYPEGFSGPSTEIIIQPITDPVTSSFYFGENEWRRDVKVEITLVADTFCVWETEAIRTYTYTTTAMSFESTRGGEAKSAYISITDANPRISEIISVDKGSPYLGISNYSWDKANNKLTFNYINLTGETITTQLTISYYA